jgi:hypothetical protein
VRRRDHLSFLGEVFAGVTIMALILLAAILA